MDAKPLEFTSMAALLAPGPHKTAITHFRVTEAFNKKIEAIYKPLAQWTTGLVQNYYETGQEEHINECFVLKKLLELIDQLVQPRSLAEVAYCTYIAGAIMPKLSESIMAQLAHPPRPDGFSSRRPTATA